MIVNFHRQCPSVIEGLAITLPNRIEFGVDNLAVSLLFRYPIWATTDLPHGRWYPYVGIGGGFQRARLSTQGYEETSYSPLFQGLVGVKFFLIKHVAIFGEPSIPRDGIRSTMLNWGRHQTIRNGARSLQVMWWVGSQCMSESTGPKQLPQPRACSSCSCRVLHSMQSVVTGRALSRL
jgi:hypothetical protein